MREVKGGYGSRFTAGKKLFHNSPVSASGFIYTIVADRTVSKRPGTSHQIEIHFAVVNHLYLLFSFEKVVET